MRNSFKGFFSSNSPKFQVVKFNPNGHNSAIKLNLFSSANAGKDSVYNAILFPTFDNKSFYSNFTYKYFNLKWSKFEQKLNYHKYVKSPSQFPNFLITTNYFINSFLTRRRKKRIYKRRKIRYSVYFKNRYLRSTKSIFRSYRLRSFFGKKKIFRLRKKLLRSLVRKNTFKVIFSKYWVRRRWIKFSKRHKSRKPRKFFKIKNKSLRKSNSRQKNFYFKKRSYRLKIFKFFRFKKNLKKIRYARRYAYRKIRLLRKFSTLRVRPSSFLKNYEISDKNKKIFKFNFFKRLVKSVIKRRYFFFYIKQKLTYKIRTRIFTNRFGMLRFLGFKNYLFKTYFDFTFPSFKLSKKKESLFFNFSYFFNYPQKLVYSKNNFYFKFFSIYNLIKNKKLNRYKLYFKLNLKNYYNFFKTFKDFFSMISVFKFNFIPFKFNIFKKNYLEKFKSRVDALQYLQRRKLVRNLRFCTYFFLFIKITQTRRGTKFYRKIMKKFIKSIYRRLKAGRMLFFLPFVFNKFLYFGLTSHINSNIYLRDPIKFNDFYSVKLRKSKFILHNKI